MGTAASELKTALTALSRAAGAQRCGFAEAGPVDAGAENRFSGWLAAGRHASMAWMEKYADVRHDPRRLLDPVPEGPCTVMVCAFSYYHPERQEPHAARFAMYAHGSDYHEILRARMQPLADHLASLGIAARICIDTAPLHERYWAVRAGVGFIGRNSQLIIPGMGSYFFLATLIFAAGVEADAPCTLSCLNCGRCLRACPGRAILADGTVDANRCLSYLTIEHRGPLPENIIIPKISVSDNSDNSYNSDIINSSDNSESIPLASLLGIRVYGCDTCQSVCPHNSNPPLTEIPEFRLRPALRDLTPAAILDLTPSDFSHIFSHSAVKRARLAGLQRTAAILTPTHKIQ